MASPLVLDRWGNGSFPRSKTESEKPLCVDHRPIRTILFLCFSIATGVSLVVSPPAAFLLVALLVVCAFVLQSGVHEFTVRVVNACFVGLIVFSYGFNNVRFLSLPVPLVDVVFAFAAAVLIPRWLERPDRTTRLALALTGVTTVLAAAHLAVNVRASGLGAVRDAAFVLEAMALPVGVAVAKILGRRLEGMLRLAFGVALFWFMTYPFRHITARISPTVGIDSAVALFDYSGMPFVAALALLLPWKRRLARMLLVAAALLAIVFAQSRMIYVALPAAAVVVLIRKAQLGQVESRAFARVLASGAFVLTFSAITMLALPPLPGRVGPIGLATMAEQSLTLIGRDGAGAGTIDDRVASWSDLIAEALADERTLIIGQGFGTPLDDDLDRIYATRVHNDYLEVALRLGLPAALVWLSLLVLIARTAWARTDQHPLGYFYLNAFVILMVVAFVQPLFAWAYGGLVFYFLAGLMLGTSSVRSSVRVGAPMHRSEAFT